IFPQATRYATANSSAAALSEPCFSTAASRSIRQSLSTSAPSRSAQHLTRISTGGCSVTSLFSSTIPPSLVRGTRGSLARVVRRDAAVEPAPEVLRRKRQAVLVEDVQRHRPHRSRRQPEPLAVGQQPRLEVIGVGICLDNRLEQLALNRQAERVGRCVALPLTTPALGRLQSRQKATADRGRTRLLRDRGLVRCLHDDGAPASLTLPPTGVGAGSRRPPGGGSPARRQPRRDQQWRGR